MDLINYVCMLLNNNLISDIYFSILLIILIFLSLIITYQIVKLIFLEVNYLSFKYEKYVYLTEDQIFEFAHFLIKKKMWFKAVKLLESGSLKKIEENAKYCNVVGFLYYNMKIYNLAKKYYIKALNINPSYIIALSNLARIYNLQNKKDLALNTYKDILIYDPDNEMARVNIAKLINRDSRI